MYKRCAGDNHLHHNATIYSFTLPFHYRFRPQSAIIWCPYFAENIYYRKKQYRYAGGGNEEQRGANITKTMGSTRRKQQAATIQTSKEGTYTRSRQVDDALVRRKDFKNLKEEKF
jgi:hypothetical protein